ncbi:MAG: DUF3987 domain-containing protein [Candidatus Obscuribacterales bacterium]|nr:DUF3987 domain-containing protein [Candidatus Obscuribacterales bacterium]
MQNETAPTCAGANSAFDNSIRSSVEKKYVVTAESIPLRLRSRDQWVNWRNEQRGGSRKPTKVPYQPSSNEVTLLYAKTNDRTTWSPFEKCFAAVDRFDGVGFVFAEGDGLVGIDLDNCFDEANQLESWAREIVDHFVEGAYIEYSPSRKGLHLWCQGKPLRSGKGTINKCIEVYDFGSPRYFTVTGDLFAGNEITDLQPSLDWLHETFFKRAESIASTANPPELKANDDEVITRALDYIPADDYEMWIQVGMALKAGGHDCRVWDRWSQKSPKYHAGVCEKKWRTFNRTGVGTGSIIHIAESFGYQIEKPVAYPPVLINPSEEKISLREADGFSVPWPNIRPVKLGLSPVEPFPAELLPPVMRAFATDIAGRMQVPIDFIAIPLMVIVGSIVGTGCGIRPKQFDNWLVVPNLWGGLVARPSMMKSPCLAACLSLVERLEDRAGEDYFQKERIFSIEKEANEAIKQAHREELKKAVKSGEDVEEIKRRMLALELDSAPSWRRFRTNNATIEKMGELLQANARGLLLYRDELTGFLSLLEQEDRAEDRAFYLESFNGVGSFMTDRIGRGTTQVKNMCISLLGGIQPAKLMPYLYKAMKGSNDGLAQRLQLFVYPDECDWTFVDRAPNLEADQAMSGIMSVLADTDFANVGALTDFGPIPYVRFSSDAQSVFNEWQIDLETAKLRKPDEEPIMVEHLSKYRSLMPSLALLFHLVEFAASSLGPLGPVSKGSAEMAAAWCDYLESHARRIYGMLASLEQRAAAHLSTKIKEGGLASPFNARAIKKKGWQYLDEADVIEGACEILVDLGWIRPVEMPPTGGPGRPHSLHYEINPSVEKKL